MSLKIFLKKPPEFQGLQWTLGNFKEFAQLGGLIHRSSKHDDCLEYMDRDGDWHQVKPGEWIVRDEDSALWSHTHDTMTKRYDQIKLTTIEGAHPYFIKTENDYNPSPRTKAEGEVLVHGIDIYGYCPYCAARGKSRERRLDGNDTCENGHTYKSSEALREPK